MNLSDDDFALFGLPRRFALDPAEVDARWRALQAQVHPDRLAAEGAAMREQALQRSMRVNEARARLKSPLRRAELLCQLAGVAPAARGAAMAPALLMQQMAWREALEAAADETALRQLADQVAAQERDLLEQLRVQWDERGDAAAAAPVVQALMFVTRLREDIDERRLGTDAALRT